MPVAIRSPMDAVAQSAFKPAQEQHAEHQPRQASEKVSAAPAAPGFSCGFDAPDSSYVSHCGFGGISASQQHFMPSQQPAESQQQTEQQQQQMLAMQQQQMQQMMLMQQQQMYAQPFAAASGAGK